MLVCSDFLFQDMCSWCCHKHTLSLVSYWLFVVMVTELLRKLIENDGGSKAVIAAMLTHDRHEQIQTYGCMALTNITADGKS